MLVGAYLERCGALEMLLGKYFIDESSEGAVARQVDKDLIGECLDCHAAARGQRVIAWADGYERIPHIGKPRFHDIPDRRDDFGRIGASISTGQSSYGSGRLCRILANTFNYIRAKGVCSAKSGAATVVVTLRPPSEGSFLSVVFIAGLL